MRMHAHAHAHVCMRMDLCMHTSIHAPAHTHMAMHTPLRMHVSMGRVHEHAHAHAHASRPNSADPRPLLVGIVSWGIGQAARASFFTRHRP